MTRHAYGCVESFAQFLRVDRAVGVKVKTGTTVRVGVEAGAGVKMGRLYLQHT